MIRSKTIWLSAAAVLLAGAASAQVQEARPITDLNLRSGPGSNYTIVGVAPLDALVMVEGCVEGANWCRVNYEGTSGWAAGNYLAMSIEETAVPLASGDPRVTYETMTYEEDNDGASVLAGGAAGAASGAAIGGPAGALIGGVLGMAGGDALDPPDRTTVTYVQQHPVEPIWLEGEVVTGAAIPDTVTLTPIPESTYSYSYVNGVPVIVEPQQRQIIHIVR
ncbi:DUF1236 domain-containing protein [Cereibacter azotoformans]|uniref:DUF1236 domain-containing protein n=1 Tax=Cereibacter azotoformans TaxID=43057 RepID=UPI000C6DC12C|nr:DUF1236 domain-containing protein [Cereibacter azotoformans]